MSSMTQLAIRQIDDLRKAIIDIDDGFKAGATSTLSEEEWSAALRKALYLAQVAVNQTLFELGFQMRGEVIPFDVDLYVEVTFNGTDPDEDQGSGVYILSVKPSLRPWDQAAAALDCFHMSVELDQLELYHIAVRDKEGNFIDEIAPNGELCGANFSYSLAMQKYSCFGGLVTDELIPFKRGDKNDDEFTIGASLIGRLA